MNGVQSALLEGSERVRFEDGAAAIFASVPARSVPVSRTGAVVAMLGGLGTVVLAAAIAVPALRGAPAYTNVAQPAAEPAPEATVSVAEAGAGAVRPDVSIADLVYGPGHTSGWHVHGGVHAVVVISGTLTIYDERCERQEFGPGTTYLGGDLPHLARNDGADDLRLAVTSVYDRNSAVGHGSVVPAPSGCDAR